jgi:hypothetical protein
VGTVVCISGDAVIARPPEAVFDILAAERAADGTVEYLGLDRPWRLVSSSTTPSVRVVSRVALEPVRGGTRAWWSEDLRFRGWSRALLPLLRVRAARREALRWAELRTRLETAPEPDPALV